MIGPPPPVVRDRVEGILGAPVTSEPMGGMSGSRVLRLAAPGGTIVAKGNASPRERSVYRTLAPAFAGNRIRIPECHGDVVSGDEVWLLLEDIPFPLPRERWLADPAVMAILLRLHRLPSSILDALPDRFQPAWTEAMDRAALGWLGDEPGLGDRLAELRQEAQPLFRPRGPISGDPNPLNWGLSGAGELVLMDWERIGLGHPAIDVAITVPGLPGRADLDRTAEVYRMVAGISSAVSGTVETRLLVLAKVWTVMELLAGIPPGDEHVGGAQPARRRLALAVALAGVVPEWIRRVT